MVAYNKELGIIDVGFVLDRGFCSTASVKFMAKENLLFILGVENPHKTTIKAIDFARENILSLRLTSLNVQAIAIRGCFYGVPAIMYIYFDPEFSINLAKGGAFTYERDFKKIDKAAENFGFFCLLSTTELDSTEALIKYRNKDVIEKSI